MKFLKKIKLAFPLLILLIPGCGYPPLSEDIAVPSDYTYIIGPGDQVQIFVWGNPDISTTAIVRPDGKITIPLAEDLLASGKTPSELARVMEKHLEKYVRDPQVVIMVAGFQGVFNQQVRIVGQLSGGGSSGGGMGGGMGGGAGAGFSAKAFPYKKDMTLLDLMIQVGGLGQYADGNRASIVRNIKGKNQQFGIKINDLINKGNLRANVKILPGDIVIIPEAFF
ncbi:MAG: polysaccharide export protein [Methylovulum sp.]|nr:polysaccharide export protein [Methylovulum sp.]